MPNLRSQIKLLRLSSREFPDQLDARLPSLKKHFSNLQFSDVLADPSWPYTAGAATARTHLLQSALGDPTVAAIWCARGGYGASDLLHELNWEKLKDLPEKILVGFSDVSALHSAFYTRLGWRGLHAPMPATALWSDGGDDIASLKRILRGDSSGEVPLRAHGQPEQTGRLFGGCFSVLTNLIGTPFFPPTLSGHILMWEDTGENPGRLMRYVNQWLHAGALEGVKAIVLGDFRDCGEPQSYGTQIVDQIAIRTGLPVYGHAGFGHCSPNFPFMIGAQATIRKQSIKWHLKEDDKLWG